MLRVYANLRSFARANAATTALFSAASDLNIP